MLFCCLIIFSCSGSMHSLDSLQWTCYRWVFDFVMLCPSSCLGMKWLCCSLPSLWSLWFIWLTLCLSFLSFTVSECFALSSLHWVLCIGLLQLSFAMVSNLFTLPVDFIVFASFAQIQGIFCQLAFHDFFLLWLVVCHPDCFTWPSLRSPLSLVDLYARCRLGNHVVWGGVLEYGWLMPHGSPHDSPLCLNPWTTWIVYIESLTWEFYPERDELPSTCIICSSTMLPVWLKEKGVGAAETEPSPSTADKVSGVLPPFACLSREIFPLPRLWANLGRLSPERLFAILSLLEAPWLLCLWWLDSSWETHTELVRQSPTAQLI